MPPTQSPTHPRRSRAAAVVLAVALAPALAACGGAGQAAVEKAAEQAAEQAIGGSANVDIGNGDVNVTDASGNAMAVGADVALPDTWPTAVPAYPSGTLTVVTVQVDGSAYAAWQVDSTAQEAADAYAAQLEAAGYTTGDQGAVAGSIFREFTGSDYTVTISATDADGQSMLMVTANPAS